MRIMPVTILLGVFAALSVASGGEPSETTCDAAQVWERMVSAKGGRPALHYIRTFFIAEKYRWREWWRTRTLDSRVLFIFPDFVWAWWDPGGKPLPISVSVTAGGFRTTAVAGASKVERQADERRYTDGLIGMLLLETRWLKPELKECISRLAPEGRLVKLHVNIPGSACSLRFEIVGDNWLPNRVDQIEGRSVTIHRLQEYAPFAGIMLPRRIVRTDTLGGISRQMTFEAQYEINPPVAEEFVRMPPSIETGPEAWRPEAKPTRKR